MQVLRQCCVCRLHSQTSHMQSATSPYGKAPSFASLPSPSSPQQDTPRFAMLGSAAQQDYSSPSRHSQHHQQGNAHTHGHAAHMHRSPGALMSGHHSDPYAVDAYRSPAHAATVSAVERQLRVSLHADSPGVAGPAVHHWPPGSHDPVQMRTTLLSSPLARPDPYGKHAFGAAAQSPSRSRAELNAQYGFGASSSSPLKPRAASSSPYSPVDKPFQALHTHPRSQGLSSSQHSQANPHQHAHHARPSPPSHTHREQLRQTQQQQQPPPLHELDLLSRRLLEQRLGPGRQAQAGVGLHELASRAVSPQAAGSKLYTEANDGSSDLQASMYHRERSRLQVCLHDMSHGTMTKRLHGTCLMYCCLMTWHASMLPCMSRSTHACKNAILLSAAEGMLL